MLTIDGPLSMRPRGTLQRSIWNPTVRLEAGDIDVGPRAAHRYLGPGWSFEERERSAGGAEVTFARPVTPKAVIYVSLPKGSVELVLRASAARSRFTAVSVVGVNRIEGKSPAMRIQGKDPRRPARNVYRRDRLTSAATAVNPGIQARQDDRPPTHDCRSKNKLGLQAMIAPSRLTHPSHSTILRT